MLRLKKYGHWYFLGFLAFLAFAVWSAVFWVEAHQDLVFLYFFDVGQGDAIFIEAPDGHQVLIDGGPDRTVLNRLGEVMPFWDRSIDILVLTHPQADHLTGLLEVLKRYNVGMVLESGVNHTIPEYQEWRELIRGRNIPAVIAERGQKIRLSDNVSLAVLAPFQPLAGLTIKKINEASVVLKFQFVSPVRNGISNGVSTTALLMADAEARLERQLIAAGNSLESDLLKVGHHGSKTSSREEFLRAVRPRLAVISAGRRNRYGHPHQEVLDRLESLSILVLRTDQDGDITLVSDGKNFIRK